MVSALLRPYVWNFNILFTSSGRPVHFLISLSSLGDLVADVSASVKTFASRQGSLRGSRHRLLHRLQRAPSLVSQKVSN